MSVLKPTGATIIDEATLGTSATTALSDCTVIELTKGTQLVFFFVGTFNASATGDATVTLWPSYDGTNYVTTAWAGWSWTIAHDTDPGAGSEVIAASYPISPVPKYLKVKVANADASYTITGLKIIYNKQTAG